MAATSQVLNTVNILCLLDEKTPLELFNLSFLSRFILIVRPWGLLWVTECMWKKPTEKKKKYEYNELSKKHWNPGATNHSAELSPWVMENSTGEISCPLKAGLEPDKGGIYYGRQFVSPAVAGSFLRQLTTLVYVPTHAIVIVHPNPQVPCSGTLPLSCVHTDSCTWAFTALRKEQHFSRFSAFAFLKSS